MKMILKYKCSFDKYPVNYNSLVLYSQCTQHAQYHYCKVSIINTLLTKYCKNNHVFHRITWKVETTLDTATCILCSCSKIPTFFTFSASKQFRDDDTILPAQLNTHSESVDVGGIASTLLERGDRRG